MKTFLEVQDNRVINTIALADGKYDVEIKTKDKSHTIEQIKLLWATIDEISKAQCGNTSMSEDIYFQILQTSGVATQKLAIREDCLKDFKKKVRTLKLIGNEVIDHQPYVIVNACFKGVSEFTKQELSKAIETTIMLASEFGISNDLERW